MKEAGFSGRPSQPLIAVLQKKNPGRPAADCGLPAGKNQQLPI
jgi:hypothetical protein